MTTSTHELRKAIAERSGRSYGEVTEVLNAFRGELLTRLSAGERVRLDGLGAFEAKTRQARVGRNVRTGEPIKIPEHRAVVFRAARGIFAPEAA